MSAAAAARVPVPVAVRIEHHEPGRLGIGERRPRLSWRFDTAPAGFRQRAARIRIAQRLPGASPVITEFVVDGANQVLVPWPGDELRSRERIEVAVSVSDGAMWSDWSGPAIAEAGLLDPADWLAEAVGPNWHEEPGTDRRPGRLRHEFTLPRTILEARLHLTGHGLVEAALNGARVGDEELTPGWTSYRHRLRIATFDVTDLVRPGRNAIGVWLGDGWWRGRLGFAGGRRDVWGERLAAVAQLEVVDDTGARHVVASDRTWLAGFGPILSSSLYDGEHVDLRLDDPAWSEPGWDDAGWTPARAEPADARSFVAPLGPPVRAVQTLPPVKVEATSTGVLFDFGQNHAGRLHVRLPGGHAGTVLTFRHAEVLDQGRLALAPLRTAAATDVVVLGDAPVEWEPRFTVHGYRYAEVAGWPVEVPIEGAVESRVLHSDMVRTGWFSCSDPDLERLHENVIWGLRSNFVDVPTDCPQRDERLGWTGDLQVFAPAAAFLYDVTGMLSSWLRDVAVEQAELDWVPLWVPYFDLEPVASMPRGPSAVWGDVAVLTPDVLHTASGDVGLLREQYHSARAFVEACLAATGPDLVCAKSAQLGDWLDPAAPPEDPAAGRTDRYLVATAYLAHSAGRLAAIAEVLGETADATRFDAVAHDVAAAYATRFLAPDGRAQGDAQTAYALTGAFGLWPDARGAAAGADRLAELVRGAGYTVGTGFAGTPALLDALSGAGHLDVAYRLLLSGECPSWLYAVHRGATTIWERWDAIRPDGSLNDPTMTSFNHYAFGAVADWLHRVVAGIEPAAPGWRRIRFAPRPGGGVQRASAQHTTPYGTARIAWRLDGDRLRGDVLVPVGTTAQLQLPGAAAIELGHGAHEFSTKWEGQR